jgi:hypothetical protein
MGDPFAHVVTRYGGYVVVVLVTLAAILPLVYKDLYWILKIRGLFGGPDKPAPAWLDRRAKPRATPQGLLKPNEPDESTKLDGPSK